MKSKNVFWGIYLILAAAILVFAQLNWFEGRELLKIAAFILITPIMVKSAWHLMFAGVFFPLAIVIIVLNITSLSVWVILLSALLLTIGFHLVFGNPHFVHHFAVDCCSGDWEKDHEHFDTVVNSPDENIVNFGVNFGSSIKYINSEELKRANLRCSFGALKVYFDSAKLSSEGAEIYIDVSFGAMELYVPKTWKIMNNAHVSLSGVEEKGRYESNAIPVKLLGNVSFSGVEIIYI